MGLYEAINDIISRQRVLTVQYTHYTECTKPRKSRVTPVFMRFSGLTRRGVWGHIATKRSRRPDPSTTLKIKKCPFKNRAEIKKTPRKFNR